MSTIVALGLTAGRPSDAQAAEKTRAGAGRLVIRRHSIGDARPKYR